MTVVNICISLCCHPTVAEFLCSIPDIVIAFHTLAHGALGAAILINTLTPSLRSLTTGIWHQATTVTWSTTAQSTLLNGRNDIIHIIRKCKVIDGVHYVLLLFLFIKNCILGFVKILRKLLSFDLHAIQWFIPLSYLSSINLPALHFLDLQATKWFVSLHALIFDDPMWELIFRTKYF